MCVGGPAPVGTHADDHQRQQQPLGDVHRRRRDRARRPRHQHDRAREQHLPLDRQRRRRAGARRDPSVTHSRPAIRELLDRIGRHPRRDLGQNFVADPNTVRRIAELAGVGPGDHVVEVGAGLGSLTLALAETGAAVTAVEVDDHLVPVLRRGRRRPPRRHRRARRRDAARLGGAARRLRPLDPRRQPALQHRHPAGRRPARRASRPSATCSSWCSARWPNGWRRRAAHSGLRRGQREGRLLGHRSPRRRRCRPACSYPVPTSSRRSSTSSATIRLPAPPGELFELVRRGFNQRRKMLRRSLAGSWPTTTTSPPPVSSPPPGPEELSVDDWVRLRDVLRSPERSHVIELRAPRQAHRVAADHRRPGRRVPPDRRRDDLARPRRRAAHRSRGRRSHRRGAVPRGRAGRSDAISSPRHCGSPA